MSTLLYRFRLDLSDVDRSVYQRLDFRLALHPSEAIPFLLTRMLAYALNYEEGLAFSAAGLSEPDDPCLSQEDPRGGKALWIEVGNPSARRLHKAAKASKKVKVYTYKNAAPLVEEIRRERVHQGSQIEVFSLAPDFLEALEALLERDNQWGLVRDRDSLFISTEDSSVAGDLRAHPV